MVLEENWVGKTILSYTSLAIVRVQIKCKYPLANLDFSKGAPVGSMQFNCQSERGVEENWVIPASMLCTVSVASHAQLCRQHSCYTLCKWHLLKLCSSWLNSHRIQHELCPLEVYRTSVIYIFPSSLRDFVPSIILSIT